MGIGQQRYEMSSQFGLPFAIDVLVYRLVRNGHDRVVGKHRFEPSGNLFGRVVLFEPGVDEILKFFVCIYLVEIALIFVLIIGAELGEFCIVFVLGVYDPFFDFPMIEDLFLSSLSAMYEIDLFSASKVWIMTLSSSLRRVFFFVHKAANLRIRLVALSY